MNFLDKTFGRLGNRLFQTAFFYSYARDKGIDFYYQDPVWFERYGDEIKQIFKQEGEPLDYVAIHVRRGDYVNNPFYVDLCHTQYYSKAVCEFIASQKVLIFSDNIDFCKNYFKDFSEYLGNKIEYSENKSELEDFNLMTRCKHQIIANSSFSWWAAYLNPNPNKKVIAPKAWYSDGAVRTKCASNCIQI